MAITAEEVRIIVDAEVNKALSGLKKTDSQTTKLTAAFKKLAGPVALGAVALKAIEVGKEFSQLAAGAEETRSKFNTVFKDQAVSVAAWADEYADAVGRSSTDTLAFLATIQDTLVPLGFARDAAGDLSKQVIELAGDLASFNNLPTADVVRDIQSAIVGNTETLRKYGVVASQVAIEQEALNSGIWAGEGAITAQEKAAAILNLTLKGTEDAQGDLERTQDSAANVARKLEAAQKDLGIVLGDLLNDVLTPIREEFTKIIESQTSWLEFVKQQKDDQEGLARGFSTLTEQLEAYDRELENLRGQSTIGLGPLAEQEQKEAIARVERLKAATEGLILLQDQVSLSEQERARNAEIIARSQEALNRVNEKGNMSLEERRDYLQGEIEYLAQYRTLPGVQATLNTLVAKRNALDIAGATGVKSLADETGKAIEATEGLSTEYRTMDSVVGGLGDTTANLVDSVVMLAQEMEKLPPIGEQVRDALVNASASIGESFGQALAEGASFAEASKELLKDAAATTLRVIAAEATARALLAYGTGNVGQGVALTAAAVSAGAAAGAIASFANGGSHSGGLRIVGENGPELEATGPSRIYNARQTERMLSGGNVVLNFTGAFTEELAVDFQRKIESAQRRGLR